MKRLALVLLGIAMLPMALGCCCLHHGFGSGYGYGAGCPGGNCGPGGYVPGTLGAPGTFPGTTQAIPPGGAYPGDPSIAQFGAPAGVPITVSQPIHQVSGYADSMPRKSLPTY